MGWGKVGWGIFFYLFFFWGGGFWFKIKVNNCSVMMGWSHRFIGIYQYFGELRSRIG